MLAAENHFRSVDPIGMGYFSPMYKTVTVCALRDTNGSFIPGRRMVWPYMIWSVTGWVMVTTCGGAEDGWGVAATGVGAGVEAGAAVGAAVRLGVNATEGSRTDGCAGIGDSIGTILRTG